MTTWPKYSTSLHKSSHLLLLTVVQWLRNHWNTLSNDMKWACLFSDDTKISIITIAENSNISCRIESIAFWTSKYYQKDVLRLFWQPVLAPNLLSSITGKVLPMINIILAFRSSSNHAATLKIFLLTCLAAVCLSVLSVCLSCCLFASRHFDYWNHTYFMCGAGIGC